ncbi:MAG: MerR family transcriptional regulator [Planctomycetes bacterium]|nr:MerR family transcriptional regulator [Planctomycetota bacterium]
MTPKPLEDLTLDDLCRDVTRLLRQHGLLETQPDGRVNEEPNARMVRYYSTLGLLDRPRIVDREARYGWKQVLQLLAIKALQQHGYGLSEIQPRLIGLAEADLEAILRAVSDEHRARPAAVPAVTWREIAVQPGLRIQVEDGWSAPADPEALLQKIRAALAALSGEKK